MASAWESKRHHSILERAAAFLPSLLDDDALKSNHQVQPVHGVLLFADISGFTALTEKFLQRSSADRGTDELAQTLNCYMSDILKGDAVLVLWRTPPQELAKTISLVLQCSQQIQKKHGSRNTRVGLKLQLKIGISAGPMSLLIVGGGRRQYFCIYGQALAEVCEAEELAQAGEVILSATAWELCEQRRLRTQRLAGKRAVKVGGWDGL
ncbi:adenylate cyclase type 10-like isoform 4-T4 [Theristicus caerulescens]